MKRDMDLVREILVQVEAADTLLDWAPVAVAGRTSDEVSLHICLLAEAGLLLATDTSTQGNFEWRADRLTWAGYEFLDAVRNDTVWTRVKAAVAEKGGSVPFAVLKALALNALRQHFPGLGELV